MCKKNPTYQFSLKLEHFEILRILAAILKMAAKITAILKSHWSRSHSSKYPKQMISNIEPISRLARTQAKFLTDY
jgi:hypothetical protein